MGGGANWKDGVRVVRGATLAEGLRAATGMGRATAFDFPGATGQQTWVGTVTQPIGYATGTHHHGADAVVLFVAHGTSEIRWGERLEYAAVVGAGDFVYFQPFVPHQEATVSPDAPVQFVVVRSDNKGFVAKLDTPPVATPETVY